MGNVVCEDILTDRMSYKVQGLVDKAEGSLQVAQGIHEVLAKQLAP